MEEKSKNKNERNKNKNKKDYLFSFTKINKYFIFPFICPIICFLSNFFLDLIMHVKGINNSEFLVSMIFSFSYILGGLLYFISWIRTKTDQTRDDAKIYKRKATFSVKYIYNDGSKKDKMKIFLILLIMSILLVLTVVFASFYYNKNILEQRIYYLFFIPIFSKILLKLDIFSHQILSLFIAIFGFILLLMPILLMITKNDILPNIFVFLSSILFSLFLVLCKYLTQFFYISPYLCNLLIGIISTLMILSLFIIYSLIRFHNFKYFIDAFNFSNIEINGVILGLYFFASFFFSIILDTLTILIVYYFSPTLFIVTDIISPFLSWLVICIRDGDKRINIIFNSLGYFIVFFSSLIYNEIIICNFFGFNKNTKKCIEERQKEELAALREDESFQNGNQGKNEYDSSFYTENNENDG